MYKLIALLWIDPLIVLETVVFGTLSMICSLVDKTGHLQHRVARVWARLLVRTSGMRVKVTGLEHLEPGRPYVLVANHLSLLDIPVIVAALPLQFRFFAKEGLFRIPLLGGHLRRAGHLPVARDNPRQGLRLLSAAAQAIAKRGVSVLNFPEGGRSPSGVLQPFRGGPAYLAIKAGVPAVPIALEGTRECLPMGSVYVRPGPVRLAIGKPLPTTGMRVQDHELFTEQLHKSVGELIAGIR